MRFLVITRNDIENFFSDRSSCGNLQRQIAAAAPHFQKEVVIPNESAIGRRSEESPVEGNSNPDKKAKKAVCIIPVRRHRIFISQSEF
jgi:hypothetical protein